MLNFKTASITIAQSKKEKIIFLLRELLNDRQQSAGKDDGELQFIEEANILVDDYEKYSPEILCFVDGGNLQGISATEPMAVEVYDLDNYKGGDSEFMKTPEEWNELINTRTANNEIVGVY